MTTDQDTIERATKILLGHEIVWVGHEEGYDCGCNENGDQFPEGLHYATDAVQHQIEALADAGLLTDPSDAALATIDRMRWAAIRIATRERHANCQYDRTSETYHEGLRDAYDHAEQIVREALDEEDQS